MTSPSHARPKFIANWKRLTSHLICDDTPQSPNASDPSAYWRSAEEQHGDWGDIFCILSCFVACVQFWAEIEIAKSWNTPRTFADRDVNRDNQLCQKCAVPIWRKKLIYISPPRQPFPADFFFDCWGRYCQMNRRQRKVSLAGVSESHQVFVADYIRRRLEDNGN